MSEKSTTGDDQPRTRVRNSVRRSFMIVMPANSSGWFWHTLAHETGKLGHLYSPGAQRGPWPWFPYAMDNGCFALWNPADNSFDEEGWKSRGEMAWRKLIFWAQVMEGSKSNSPLWAITPDRPGKRDETLSKWGIYAGQIVSAGYLPAVAVQDGFTAEDVKSLDPQPAVVCVGGSTDWKWETAQYWASNFKRVHLLRCNAPSRLEELEKMGFESCDGSGWSRGDRTQTKGLEEWARGWQHKTEHPLWPHVCRSEKKAHRQLPGMPTQETLV